MASLSVILAEVRSRIAAGSKRGLNEQNTKATLIEPIMRALGWDTENIEEVVREYRLKRRDKPVDYALLVLREPRLFVEAKALGENLDDRRWANQIMGYAGVAGVGWIVLTNGDEFRIYNTHASVPVEQKLFRSVRMSEPSSFVADTLGLLAKDRLEEERIEVLWRAQFVDRQVKSALEDLFGSDNDMLVVNHVLQRTKNLTAGEVRSSLRRCKVDLDFPVSTEVPIPTPTRRGRGKRAKQSTGGTGKQPHTSYDVSLRQLIDAGLLHPPVQLRRRYKGRDLIGRVEPDGRVTTGGKSYSSLSMAGGAARASVTGLGPAGKLRPTNGWTFWRMARPDGTLEPVDVVRQEYLARRQAEQAG